MYRILALSFLIDLFCPVCGIGQSYEKEVKPILKEHCFECHSGDEPAGDVGFDLYNTDRSIKQGFEVWGKVARVIDEKKMPPEDEPQLAVDKRRKILTWYQRVFVETVQASPGTFRPRRLSAVEYRNTMRSLFGFDLEQSVMQAEQTITEKSLVMKLLPTDPPGASGFTNDTHNYPLSTQIWEQYSYLADFALEQLFTEQYRPQLEALVGAIPGEFERSHSQRLVRKLWPRIARRDLNDKSLVDAKEQIEKSPDVIEATKREIKKRLMGPGFVYRGLLMPRSPGEEQDVDTFELAERLSYFIWADMPDDELFDLARSGRLDDPTVLYDQVERMLDSDKANSLATSFATEWLSLNEIEHVSNNPPMMVAYKSQPLDFINYLIRENRPLMELIDSRTTFANPLTRKFYGADASRLQPYRKPKGIEVEIVPNSKLALDAATWRGGILTMPGVLAMNRGPILRGVWMVERIMGEHLPDPPADVGQVKGNVPGENLSFRERFSQHRENESCAICHDKIDPLGFALAAYDDRGSYRLRKAQARKPKKKNKRESEEDDRPIDTSGRLPSGEEFADFDELKQILMTSQRESIVRNVVKKTMAYALCRKLELYDRPAVETIVAKMMDTSGTWRDLIHHVVNSLPFRRTYVPPKGNEGK